jgi:hypothetical protein
MVITELPHQSISPVLKHKAIEARKGTGDKAHRLLDIETHEVNDQLQISAALASEKFLCTHYTEKVERVE